MEKHVLSKSTFIRGVQCLKSLYLNKKRPFLRDRLSAEQRAKFSRGHDVGLLAQELFPGGSNMKPKSPSQYRKAVEETSELIKATNDQVIYEATFQAEGVLIMLDVLTIKEGKLYAYEVKSSKAISETYIMDAALQYYVMQKAGFQPTEFSIIYMNKDYVMRERLEIRDLFVIESVLDRILPLQKYIEEQIEAEKVTLQLAHSPKIDIGRHCFTPYPCDFMGHCWKHLPERSVFDLSFLSFDERLNLYNNKISSAEEIKEEHLDNKGHIRRIDAVAQNSLFLDCNAISETLKESGKSPVFLYVLTRKPATPEYPGTKPYQAIPFGIGSISELNAKQKSGSVVFGKGADPFLEFLQYFENLQKEGHSFIVFDQAFISSILQEALKRADRKLQEKEINLIDLSEVFKNFAVFQAGLDVNANLYSISKHLLKETPTGKIRSKIEAIVAYQKSENNIDFEEIASFQMENLRILKKLFEFLKKKCNIV